MRVLLPLLASLPSDVDFETLDREGYRLIWFPKKFNFLANFIEPVFIRLMSRRSNFSSSFDKSATADRGAHGYLAARD